MGIVCLFLFFFLKIVLLLRVSFLVCAVGTNLLGALHLPQACCMYLFGKNTATSVAQILNIAFHCSSLLQCVQCPRQNFCLYRFILPSSCSDPCEIQNATCFFLSSVLVFMLLFDFFLCFFLVLKTYLSVYKDIYFL